MNTITATVDLTIIEQAAAQHIIDSTQPGLVEIFLTEEAFANLPAAIIEGVWDLIHWDQAHVVLVASEDAHQIVLLPQRAIVGCQFTLPKDCFTLPENSPAASQWSAN